MRDTIDRDELLWELVKTPLLLSIVVLAYHRSPTLTVPIVVTLEERRVQLFSAYTEAMFTRRSKVACYTREDSICWLGWLASSMQRHHQSVFYLEWMQPDWLLRPIERWAVSVGSVMMLCGRLVGVVVGYGSNLAGEYAWSFPVSLAFGVVGGLVVDLLGHGDQVWPITRLGWSWAALRNDLGHKIILALGAGTLLSAGITLVFNAAVATPACSILFSVSCCGETGLHRYDTLISWNMPSSVFFCAEWVAVTRSFIARY